MKQKKTTVIALIFCLILSAAVFTACTKQDKPEPKEEDVPSKISNKIDAYTTDLMDSTESMQSNQSILKYLSDWADAKKIDHRTDKAGNLIFTKAASKGCESLQPTVLICPCENKQYQQCIPPIATSLYLIKNSGETGKLTIVYSPSEGDRYKALSGAEKSLFPANARIVTLSPGTKGVFAIGSSAGSSYRFKLKARKTKPQLKIAYRISLSGLPTGLPDARVDDVPNPIEEMEHILTWITNKKNAFELASFQGGIDQALYPQQASITITIDANDEEDFVEKMDKNIESWTEKHSKDYPDAVYTYEKVDVPTKVYNSDTTHKLVSFLYTLLDGEYYRDDDGELISICSLTRIQMAKKSFQIYSSAYSLDEASLREIDTGEMTLANLSGTGYEVIHRLPLWNSQENSEFTKAVKTSYDKTSGKSLTYSRSVAPTCASVLQTRTDCADVLNITVSDNIVKECTATLLDYMSSQTESEEEETQQ